MRVKQQWRTRQLSSWLAWYRASLTAWFFHTLDPPKGYRHIYIWLAFQTEGKSIYLLLLSRVKGSPTIGKIPLDSQIVHVCYWATPVSSHASTSTGKTDFCVDLYIPFGWSGTPAHSQLVLCEILCIWRCIPDASAERDVLPLLLPLHLLSSSWIAIIKFLVLSTRKIFMTIPV